MYGCTPETFADELRFCRGMFVDSTAWHDICNFLTMKNILSLAILLLTLGSCAYKKDCKNPIEVRALFYKEGTNVLTFVPDSSNTDTVMVIERYKQGSYLKQKNSSDTLKLRPFASSHMIFLHKLYSDPLYSDYGFLFYPSGKQFFVTDIIVANKQIKCDDQDCPECYNEITAYTINNQIGVTDKSPFPSATLRIRL